MPAPVREALRLAREERPRHRLRCLAFHSAENGREVARLGLTFAAGLRPKDVMVLTVAVTETLFEDVRTVSHTLVIRVEADAVEIPRRAQRRLGSPDDSRRA